MWLSRWLCARDEQRKQIKINRTREWSEQRCFSRAISGGELLCNNKISRWFLAIFGRMLKAITRGSRSNITHKKFQTIIIHFSFWVVDDLSFESFHWAISRVAAKNSSDSSCFKSRRILKIIAMLLHRMQIILYFLFCSWCSICYVEVTVGVTIWWKSSVPPTYLVRTSRTECWIYIVLLRCIESFYIVLSNAFPETAQIEIQVELIKIYVESLAIETLRWRQYDVKIQYL